MRSVILAVVAVLSVPLTARQGGMVAPVVYQVSFPAPEHRFAQVEATFSQVPQPLELRMSRSSPGRYALHEFAKNVYDVHACRWRRHRAGDHPSEPIPMERDQHRRRRACAVQGVRRSRRRHVPGHRRDTRAHESAGDADVGTASGRPAGACDVRAARRSRLEARDAALPRRHAVDVHGAEPSVPVRQPDRAQRLRAARVHGAQSRRQDVHDSRGRALRRVRRGGRSLRGGPRENRQRSSDGLR